VAGDRADSAGVYGYRAGVAFEEGRKMNRALYSSFSCEWATPEGLFQQLDQEFHFTDDPCPKDGMFGLDREWGKRCFVNPPYGRHVSEWIEKGCFEAKNKKLIIFLLPARTDTKWFHDLILPNAKEIRFIRGRLHFINQKTGKPGRAPFPNMIIVLGEDK
jgi:site-specific DNA-methyltransferase (adenine-specific)